MIFSENYGDMSFNIDVPDRYNCMKALYEEFEFDVLEYRDLSVENLVARYLDIQDVFPDTLKNATLPYFVDWVIGNVDFVELETFNDNDAFTIFETMNDRGVSLGPVDMLKGYLLASINDEETENTPARTLKANAVWKERVVELATLKPKEDQNFFKIWLRSKYAETIRERHKGATNRDFENINRFHRWVRENAQQLGLSAPEDFYDFIVNKFDRFASHFLRIRNASITFTDGFETLYYNDTISFYLAVYAYSGAIALRR